jgi:hypothetical protein
MFRVLQIKCRLHESQSQYSVSVERESEREM